MKKVFAIGSNTAAPLGTASAAAMFAPLGGIFEATAPAAAGEPSDNVDMAVRSEAMSVALAWVEGADFTTDALDALVMGMSGVDSDEDGDLNEDELEVAENMLDEVSGAFEELGADSANVEAAIYDGDAAALTSLGEFLAGRMDQESRSDDELVLEWAARPQLIAESTRRVVRNGKVVTIKRRLRRRVMTSAQRASLKKARLKAFTGAARLKRAKAMKIRKSRGL